MSDPRKVVEWSTCFGVPEAETLVLLLHGLDSSPATIRALSLAVEKERPSSYILVPKLPLAWHSCVDLRMLACELLAKLAEVMGKRSYQSILLIGHSAGGVLAQAMYLIARKAEGSEVGADLKGARLVLLAPLNRGWEMSHHLPLSKKLAWSLGLFLLPVFQLLEQARSLLFRRQARPPWILQLRRSSPFLVWFRASWLELAQRNPEEKHEVVQLLGSIDELVSWRDMVDAATGQSFVYLEVPFSDHVSIIDLEDERLGSVRERVFKKALGDFDQARGCEFFVEPWDNDPIPPDESVRRVVFVIHGIRDEGHWTQKIAARAKREYAAQEGRSRDEIEVITSSYGYFSMLQFLRYGQRREKVNWLVEEYMEAKRRYPCARFSFIGHSNGTYLAAHALQCFPEIEFERLAFAGSVVSSRFRWNELKGRYKYILNYTATTDWVVAIFPRIADLLPLRWLLGPNLGGAGIEPFSAFEGIQTLGYRKGQHSAAIEEENWPYLARFAVLEGDAFNFPAELPEDFKTEYQNKQFLLFRPFWGPVTSVVGWAIVLAILMGALPWLAWNKPSYLWLAPLPLLVGLTVAISVAEEMSGRFPLRRRKKVRKMLRTVLLGAAVVAFLFLLLGSPFLASLREWNHRAPEALRTLSVVAYAFGMFRLLTRV